MCNNESCEKPIRAKGLCQFHYYKSLYPTNSKRPQFRYKARLNQAKPQTDLIDKDDLWEFVKKELKIA